MVPRVLEPGWREQPSAAEEAALPVPPLGRTDRARRHGTLERATGCSTGPWITAEQWAPARAFAAEVRRRGLDTEVRVLTPGTGLTHAE